MFLSRFGLYTVTLICNCDHIVLTMLVLHTVTRHTLVECRNSEKEVHQREKLCFRHSLEMKICLF
jgi:hypothetical protein